MSQSHVQKTVDEIRHLNEQQELPDHFASSRASGLQYHLRHPDDFDPNRYFRKLNHLHMEPGYTLDYIYRCWGGDGCPVAYARKEGETDTMLYARLWPDSLGGYDEEEIHSLVGDVLNHVIADGTPEGFFQLAVFVIMGGQFYLAWHALYNDRRILCDESALRDLINDLKRTNYGTEPSQDLVSAAFDLDLAPRITMTDSTCIVSLVTFSKWKGFARERYSCRRRFPHVLECVEVHVELQYDCRIAF